MQFFYLCSIILPRLLNIFFLQGNFSFFNFFFHLINSIFFYLLSPRCITFSIIFYVIIYNYFNCEHWSFLSKYFEQYDELKSNNNITNDGNLQDSKMKNFFLINKIYQFFNFLYEYIFKPSVTI